MKYGLRIDLAVTGPGSLEESVERVVEEFAKLEGCTDGLLDFALGANLVAGDVEVEITVEADALEDAVSLGVSSLRTAIHAAGGGTPNWDTLPLDESLVQYVLDKNGLIARPLIDA